MSQSNDARWLSSSNQHTRASSENTSTFSTSIEKPLDDLGWSLYGRVSANRHVVTSRSRTKSQVGVRGIGSKARLQEHGAQVFVGMASGLTHAYHR